MANAVCTVFTLMVAGSPVINSPQPIGTCGHCCEINKAQDIKFYLYTSASPQYAKRLYINDIVGLQNSRINFQNQLAVYIHGFTETTVGNGIIGAQKIKSAFMQRGGYDVLLIDWGRLTAAPWYPNAVHNVPVTGRYAAQLLRFLIQNGLSPDRIHVIGFSLGAEVAGSIGKQLTEWGIYISRITGLDPALPLFKGNSENRQLRQTTAKFVDVIHTDGGNLGNMDAMGHADFYPNRGTALQPGCSILDLSCSHGKAWKYFAASILNPQSFRTRHNKGMMGLGANSGMRGKFYLRVRT